VEPFSPWDPGWTVTFGAVKVTIAPLSNVTLLPNVIDVALLHEHVFPAGYVALVIMPFHMPFFDLLMDVNFSPEQRIGILRPAV